MQFFSHFVTPRLANNTNLFVFSESRQEIITSPVMHQVVKYLLNGAESKYSCYEAEHIYVVDSTFKQLNDANFLSHDLIERLDSKMQNYNGIISLLDEKWSFTDVEAFEETTLVFVDDFLDKRLIGLVKSVIKGDFQLIKPFGKYPSISPIFGKEKSCYYCFADRLLKNQPARHWWYLNQAEKIFVPAPVFANQNIRSVVQLASTASKIELTVFNEKYALLSKHLFMNCRNCLECGDKFQFIKQTNQPIKINSALKNNYRDGGFRTVEPEITLAKLKTLVDPITGYICNSHTQKQVDETKNVTYFSSFYTQPYCNTTFKPEQFIYTTMGKGISHQQSQISALSEAVERISSQYHGDEPILHCKQSELVGEYVAIEKLTPFSTNQYIIFDQQLKETNLNQIHQCQHYQDQPINWTFGWSLLTNNKVHLPFNFCYANTPFEDQYTNFFHNGGSAGNCIEEAILQGLFELIERDAVALWWYNKLECPRVNYSSVSPTLLKQIEEQLSPEYEVWVLDLTQDIQVPVMCAIAQHKQMKTSVMGFGCHLDATISCQRALTELFQLIEIKDNNTSPFSFDDIQQEGYLFGDKETVVLPTEVNNATDLKTDIEFCLEELQKINVDVIVINNSRASLNFSSVKVIIPGLCHIFPYFGLQRLYQVPVKMGWLDKPKLESELNQQALLI